MEKVRGHSMLEAFALLTIVSAVIIPVFSIVFFAGLALRQIVLK